MSLRPEIYGFDYKKMLSIAGSKNENTFKALSASLIDSYTFPTPEKAKPFEDVLRKIIYAGFLWTDLDLETEFHVGAVDLVARYEQNLLNTQSSIWKMAAFACIADDIFEMLDEDAKNLLLCFLNGRTLLGKRNGTNWSYYGWLSLNETVRLVRRLKIVRASHKSILEKSEMWEFFNVWIGWLQQIVVAEQDLYFIAR